jgi:hypothetical protein
VVSSSATFGSCQQHRLPGYRDARWPGARAGQRVLTPEEGSDADLWPWTGQVQNAILSAAFGLPKPPEIDSSDSRPVATESG